MFQHQGIWFADGERHFPEWMTKNGELVDGRGTYQIKKFRASMEYVKQFRTAVDVGGHVGLWSMHMAKRFQVVHAFEPHALLRECFAKNVPEPNVQLHAYALGDAAKSVAISFNPADTGDSHVIGNGDIPMRTLDSFQLQDVDFIKIDCEGHEDYVVQGAEETIKRWRPTMIVEQKQYQLKKNTGRSGTPALDILLSWGAREARQNMGGDYIIVF